MNNLKIKLLYIFILIFLLFNLNSVFASEKSEIKNLNGVFKSKDLKQSYKYISDYSGNKTYRGFTNTMLDIIIDFNNIETGFCDNFSIVHDLSNNKYILLINNGYINFYLHNFDGIDGYIMELPFIYELDNSGNIINNLGGYYDFNVYSQLEILNVNDFTIEVKNGTTLCTTKYNDNYYTNIWKLKDYTFSVSSVYSSDFTYVDFIISFSTLLNECDVYYSYDNYTDNLILYDSFSADKKISDRKLKFNNNVEKIYIVVKDKTTSNSVKKLTYVFEEFKFRGGFGNKENFNVDFKVVDFEILYTPKLNYNSNQFTIQTKLSNKSLSHVINSDVDYSNWVDCINYHQYSIKIDTACTINQFFRIINNDTNEVVYTYSINYVLKENGTVSTDTSDSTLYDNISVDTIEASNFSDIINSVKSTFSTLSTFFSLLPGFIWAFIASAFTVVIILRIAGR